MNNRKVALYENCSTMGSHAIYDKDTKEFLGYCDYDPNKTRYDTKGKYIDPKDYKELWIED